MEVVHKITMEPLSHSPKEKGVNPLTGNKGNLSNLNRNGRPRGAITKKKSWKVEERLKYKHKRNPLDELIKLADCLLAMQKYEEAAEIWMTIQKYCEPTKRPVEVKEEKKSPEASLQAAEQTLDLMKELEKEFENADTGTTGTSDSQSLDNGKSPV